MDHNINIGGQVVISCPDLVQAATLFLEVFSKVGHAQVAPTVAKVEAPMTIDTSAVSDTEKVSVPETRHPGIAANGKPYGQFKEMTDLFDVLISLGCNAEVKTILSTHSKDGTYGGVSPKDWGKAIINTKEMIDAKKKAEDTAAKTYTQDELVALAKQCKDKHGIEAVKEVFAKYNVSGISKLTQEQYGDFALDVKERLGVA